MQKIAAVLAFDLYHGAVLIRCIAGRKPNEIRLDPKV